MTTARGGAASNKKLVTKGHAVISRFRSLIRSSTTNGRKKTSIEYYLTIISHAVILVRSRGYIFSPDIKS